MSWCGGGVGKTAFDVPVASDLATEKRTTGVLKWCGACRGGGGGRGVVGVKGGKGRSRPKEFEFLYGKRQTKNRNRRETGSWKDAMGDVRRKTYEQNDWPERCKGVPWR